MPPAGPRNRRAERAVFLVLKIGRYLVPVNFSMEVFLLFNLGPFHVLSSIIKEIVKDTKKTFLRGGSNITASTNGISNEISVAIST